MRNFVLFVMGVILSLTLSVSSYAQTSQPREEKTEVLQTVALNNPTIHEGVTRNGNPKFFITISDGSKTIDVTVSESNAKKVKNGEITLELVKRRNKETGKITYSTRQLGGRRKAENVDVNLNAIVIE